MLYVITGANRGIGLELCRQVKECGDEVVAVCRHRSAELDKLGVRIIDGIDVREFTDVHRLRKQLDGTKVDVLVNVAGILSKQQLGKIDESAVEAIRAQFEVNALGPVLVTQALMDLPMATACRKPRSTPPASRSRWTSSRAASAWCCSIPAMSAPI